MRSAPKLVNKPAVISPVGKLRYMDKVMTIHDGRIGALSQKLYDTITGIQTGILPDEHGWTVRVGASSKA